jgi:predicted aspartyl protease
VKYLKWIACASLALLAGPLPAQEPPQGAGPRMVRRAAAPPPQRTGERADVVMRLAGGMPTIEAMVNGRGPYRFGVDTGAPGYLRVTPALAAALGLQPVGEALMGDPGGGPTTRIPIYRADSLAFGGLSYGGVSTTSIALGGPVAGLDGIIGIGFFQELLLTFDYPGGRLTAGPGALPAANGADIFDFTLDRGALITIPLRVGDLVLQVHLDTGNTRHAFFMPAEAIAGLPTRGQARSIGVARTVSREIPLQEIDLAAPVRAGTTALPVTAVAWPAVASLGNIGSLALRNTVVTVDQANRRVRIAPGRH